MDENQHCRETVLRAFERCLDEFDYHHELVLECSCHAGDTPKENCSLCEFSYDIVESMGNDIPLIESSMKYLAIKWNLGQSITYGKNWDGKSVIEQFRDFCEMEMKREQRKNKVLLSVLDEILISPLVAIIDAYAFALEEKLLSASICSLQSLEHYKHYCELTSTVSIA